MAEGRPVAATSLAIHAAINGGDAVTGVRLGKRVAGQDHEEPLSLLREAGPDGVAVAQDFARLVRLRTSNGGAGKHIRRRPPALGLIDNQPPSPEQAGRPVPGLAWVGHASTLEKFACVAAAGYHTPWFGEGPPSLVRTGLQARRGSRHPTRRDRRGTLKCARRPI